MRDGYTTTKCSFSEPIRDDPNTERSQQTIPTPNRFATIPFATISPSRRSHSQRSRRRDDPIRNIQTIPTPNRFVTIPFATIPFETISQLRRSPFTTILPNRSPLPPNCSLYLLLLLAHRHFCLLAPLLLSSHLLAIVAEAHRHR